MVPQARIEGGGVGGHADGRAGDARRLHVGQDLAVGLGRVAVRNEDDVLLAQFVLRVAQLREGRLEERVEVGHIAWRHAVDLAQEFLDGWHHP